METLTVLKIYRDLTFEYIKEIVEAMVILAIVFAITERKNINFLLFLSIFVGTFTFVLEIFNNKDKKETIQQSIVISTLTGLIKTI
jgi:hypothetical protein